MSCSLELKKKFSVCVFGLFGHVYITTGCFDKSVKTLDDVNIRGSSKIEPISWREWLSGLVRRINGLVRDKLGQKCENMPSWWRHSRKPQI